MLAFRAIPFGTLRDTSAIFVHPSPTLYSFCCHPHKHFCHGPPHIFFLPNVPHSFYTVKSPHRYLETPLYIFRSPMNFSFEQASYQCLVFVPISPCQYLAWNNRALESVVIKLLNIRLKSANAISIFQYSPYVKLWQFGNVSIFDGYLVELLEELSLLLNFK